MNNSPITKLFYLCVSISLMGCIGFPDNIDVGTPEAAYVAGSTIKLLVSPRNMPADELIVESSDEAVVRFLRIQPLGENASDFLFAAVGRGSASITISGGDALPVVLPIIVEEVSSVSLTRREPLFEVPADNVPEILQGQDVVFGVRFNGEDDLGGVNALSIGENYRWSAQLGSRDAIVFDADELGDHQADIMLHDGTLFPLQYRVVAESSIELVVEAEDETASRANSLETVSTVLVDASLRNTETGNRVYSDGLYDWTVNGRPVLQSKRALLYAHAETMSESELTISKGALTSSVVVRGEQFRATIF